MRAARETVRDLLEEPIARAKAGRGLCRDDLEKTDISLISGMLGAALRGKTRDERAQLAGRALQLLRGVSRELPARPVDGPAVSEAVPDWEEHEKPTMPGSASMPWHPPYRRAAYALVSLLVAITGGLGNALVTANLPFLQGQLALTPTQGSWLVAAYAMVNVTANLLAFSSASSTASACSPRSAWACMRAGGAAPVSSAASRPRC